MARDANEMQEAQNRFLPEDMIGEEGEARDAVFYGQAAVLSQVDGEVGDIFAQATLAEGTGIWLTMNGQGLGYQPRDGETEEAYRARCRSIKRRVTLPAVLDGLNALLATETEAQAYAVTRKTATPFTVGEDFVGGPEGLTWSWNTIYIYLPQLPEVSGAVTVGESFVGGGEPVGPPTTQAHPLRASLEAEADALAAAGIRLFFFTYIPAEPEEEDVGDILIPPYRWTESTAGTFEAIAGGSRLALKTFTDFDIAGGLTLGAADSEPPWIWENRADLDSAVMNGDGQKALRMSTVDATQWLVNSTTAPVMFKASELLGLPGRGRWFVARATLEVTNTDYDLIGLVVADPTNLARSMRCSLRRTGTDGEAFTYDVQGYARAFSNDQDQVSVSGPTVWLAIRTDGDWADAFMADTSSATPPTAAHWQHVHGDRFLDSNSDAFRVGFMIRAAGSAEATGTFTHYSEAVCVAEPLEEPSWGARLRDTTGPTAYVEVDVGTKTLLQADLRAALGAAALPLGGETATVTWAWTRSASSPVDAPAGEDFTSSDMVTATGTGRYNRLDVKITSDGTQAGSIGQFALHPN